MDITERVQTRKAQPDDHDDIREITADTWPDREGQDYLGRVYQRWLESGERPKHTLVAVVDGQAVAIAQCVMLTDTEGWGQGLRVHPDYRGKGLSRLLTGELFAWARSQGATVIRAMVHAWNEAGLGQSRASGYLPAGTFRWVYPTVGDDDMATAHLESVDRPWLDRPPSAAVESDPDIAWRAYQGSAAQTTVGGLGLSLDESWATAEVSPSMLRRASEETAVIAIQGDAGAIGMSYRSRTFDRETDAGEKETIAEYGIASWSSEGAAAVLLDAIAREAAAISADRARVAVPNRPVEISDAALCRAKVAESAEIIMAADLAGTADHAVVFEAER